MVTRAPLYRQLMESIAGAVASGELAPGAQVPGELELCRTHGLSRSTVRAALAELEERGLVERYRGRGTFVAGVRLQCVHAPPPSPGARGIVWVVAPRPTLYLAPLIVAGARERLARAGYAVSVYDSADHPEESDRAVRRALAEGAAGILLQPPQEAVFSGAVRDLQASGFPVVLFDRPYSQVLTDCVMTDNAGGAEAVVRHLLGLGHRRVAFVAESSLRTVSVAARYEGYSRALADAGLELCDDLVVAPVRSTPQHDAGYLRDWSAAVTRMLSSRGRPTALFAVNDFAATTIVTLAHSVGMEVPGDIAVAGFDNAEFSALYSVPLTTFEQPLAAVGSRAAELLLDRLGGPVGEVRWVYMPGRLVVRESCGGGPVQGTERLTSAVPATARGAVDAG